MSEVKDNPTKKVTKKKSYLVEITEYSDLTSVMKRTAKNMNPLEVMGTLRHIEFDIQLQMRNASEASKTTGDTKNHVSMKTSPYIVPVIASGELGSSEADQACEILHGVKFTDRESMIRAIVRVEEYIKSVKPTQTNGEVDMNALGEN